MADSNDGCDDSLYGANGAWRALLVVVGDGDSDGDAATAVGVGVVGVTALVMVVPAVP